MKSKYAKQAGLITLALALMFSTVLSELQVRLEVSAARHVSESAVGQ